MQPSPLLFQVFAFIFGAIVGSFLNVVIYRLPAGLSINKPRRSFCPHCKKQIPWHHNIPLFSWLLLRGKCAHCGQPIAFRYFFVEALTGVLFLWVWNRVVSLDAPLLFLPLWILLGLLISATFIDLDHFIIPDEITLGGTAAGLVASFIFPGLMDESIRWKALLWSVAGAAAGYFILWGVVEAGKLAFGKKRHNFSPSADFKWTRQGEDAEFILGDETVRWSEMFARERDQLILETEGAEIDGAPLPPEEGGTAAAEGVEARHGTLRFFYNRLLLPGRELALDALATISGKARAVVIPREAMGFGDVKFIACIGAFIGWKGVLFTIGAASAIGAAAGVLLILAGRRNASGRIPFGPYLALGAFIWIVAGPELIAWYAGQCQ